MEDVNALMKLMEAEHAALKREDERQNERLKKLETTVENVNSIALSIQEIAVEMKHIREDVTSLNGKVGEIEKRPAKRWETIIGAIVGAVGGVIGGSVASMLIGGGG